MKIVTEVIKGKPYLIGDGWKVELTGVDSAARMRQIIEVQIAAAFIAAAIKAGYLIDVNDGEETVLFNSTSISDILGKMFTTDEDVLWLHRKGHVGCGWSKLIYGNGGWDVISDYSTDLEPLMGGKVKRLQDEFSI
jgi:hypothetical protein